MASASTSTGSTASDCSNDPLKIICETSCCPPLGSILEGNLDALYPVLAKRGFRYDASQTAVLGTWPTKIAHGTLAEKIYGNNEVLERHRHRYEFNMKYREKMGEAGFTISGTSPDGSLAELIELRDHPYFMACQYHPEFQSKPNKPHPLFKGFIQACLAHQS